MLIGIPYGIPIVLVGDFAGWMVFSLPCKKAVPGKTGTLQLLSHSHQIPQA